ncbi:hypothetical protein TNCV_5130701 [Trichonephila clavipes]|nr:hypothetical protein TNCV_5130701 [Trichonephila clavipes]
MEVDRGSRVIKVTDSWSACHEFELSTTEDPPCRGPMHVKSVDVQTSSRWCSVERECQYNHSEGFGMQSNDLDNVSERSTCFEEKLAYLCRFFPPSHHHIRENRWHWGVFFSSTTVAVEFLSRDIDEEQKQVRLEPIDENCACIEVGTTHKHLRRGVNSNNFKNYFSSNDITCEEVKSVESKFFFIGYIVRASNKGARKKR